MLIVRIIIEKDKYSKVFISGLPIFFLNFRKISLRLGNFKRFGLFFYIEIIFNGYKHDEIQSICMPVLEKIVSYSSQNSF